MVNRETVEVHPWPGRSQRHEPGRDCDVGHVKIESIGKAEPWVQQLEGSTFHNFTVPPLPAARVFPSGENEMPYTKPSHVSCVDCLPVSMLHILTPSSKLPEARVLPTGEKARQ